MQTIPVTPTKPPVPIRRTITSPKTGKKYTYDWSDPNPPTDDDLDQIIAAHESDYVPNKIETPPSPIENQPVTTGKSHGWLADTAWNAGKAALDISGVSNSPLMQMSQAAQNLSLPQAEQEKLTKEQNEGTMKAWDETFHSPWKGAKAAANYLDPTGTVPGYMDLGEAMGSDVMEKDWSGLVGHTALGALPIVAPILFRGAKRLFGGAKPSIVPPVEPIEPIAGKTTPPVTPVGEIGNIADRIRIAKAQRAATPVEVEVGDGTNDTVTILAKRKAKDAAKATSKAQAERAKAAIKTGNPTEKNAVPPIETLPKVDTPTAALSEEELGRPLSQFEQSMRKNPLPKVEPVTEPDVMQEAFNKAEKAKAALKANKSTLPPVAPVTAPTQPITQLTAIPTKASADKLSELFSKSPEALRGYFEGETATPPVNEVPLKQQLEAAAAERKPLPAVKPAVEVPKPITPPVVEPPPVANVEAPDAKLQALFENMRAMSEAETATTTPPKRGRGRPKKVVAAPVVEPLPPVDTSVVETPVPKANEAPRLVKSTVKVESKPVVETPVVEQERPTTTSAPENAAPKSTTEKYVRNELSDAYDAILREERAVKSDIPIGKRVVERLKQFHADTYPYSKRQAIEVAETLKEKAAAAQARKLAKESGAVEKPVEKPVVEPTPKVEEPVTPKKAELPEVDTSVADDSFGSMDENYYYSGPNKTGFKIKRMSAKAIAGEEKVAKNAAKRQARIDAAKKLLGDDKGFIDISDLGKVVGKLEDKYKQFKANRATKALDKSTGKFVKDSNVEALSDWVNERKDNYHTYGETDKVRYKQENVKSTKKLLKYLKDTAQINTKVKHLNAAGWESHLLGPEKDNIARLINNVHAKSWRGLKTPANVINWTKNMYLSGGVPYTPINAHGLNITRRDIQARGFGKAAKNLAEGVFQPGKQKKFLENTKDLVSDYVRKGYETGSEKGTSEAYVPLEKLFNKTKVTSLIPKGLKKAQEIFEDPLFRRHLPATKFKFVLERTDELMKKGMGLDDAMRMASKDANTFFGGINKSLRHSNAIDASKIVLLAPDWQESGIRLAGGKIGAAKRALTGKAKLGDSLYTKALGRSAVTNVATKAGALLLGKTLKDYISDPGGSTTLPMGESKSKSGNKKRELETMAGAAEEFRIPEQILLSSLNEDPLRALGDIISNRTSQPFQSLENWRTNVDRFKNPLAGKDRYGKKIPYMKGIANQALELSKPFQYQSMQALIELLRNRISGEEGFVKSAEGPIRYTSKKN